MATRITCPSCGHSGTTTRELEPGAEVRCKRCGHVAQHSPDVDGGVAPAQSSRPPAPRATEPAPAEGGPWSYQVLAVLAGFQLLLALIVAMLGLLALAGNGADRGWAVAASFGAAVSLVTSAALLSVIGDVGRVLREIRDEVRRRSV